MKAPPRTRDDDPSRKDPDDSIRALYGVISKTDFFASLTAADTDDVAQDLWEWLIRAGIPLAVISAPWLRAAVRNYIMRFRRRTAYHNAREGRSLESMPEPPSQPLLPLLESNELLDHVAAVLPSTERRMLKLIRCGYTVADAARLLRIPAGSRDFYKGRIIAYARRELQRRNRIPTRGV